MNSDEWIKDSIYQLRGLYAKCKYNDEKALTFYIAGFIKILNSIGELQTTYFHHYEWRVLWYPMKLFAKYFIEQIEDIIVKNYSYEEKNRKIGDVENSLANISEVYRNLIDGTVNSDRRMMTTLGIDTNLYELSPKLCSFYSVMLSQMVKVFDYTEGKPDNRKYSFILYPTFRRYTEMKLLFEEKQSNGKIAVINISNSIIEKYRIIPVILGHEMFHVLLRKQHLAKERALCLFRVMNIYITRMLFKGVVFNEDDREKDSSIKKGLINKWFSNAGDKARQIKAMDDDARDLYSEPIKEKCIEYINKNLKAIIGTLEEDLKFTIYSQNKLREYKDYENLNKNIKKNKALISSNIFNENANQKISDYCDKVMGLFREVFSDIACLLTLNISPDLYREAFFESEFFSSGNTYKDIFRYTRITFVSDVLKEYGNENYYHAWKELNNDAELILKSLNRSSNEKTCIGYDSYVIINADYDKVFLEYYRDCARQINDFIATHRDKVTGIQNVINDLIGTNQETFLKDVLSGVAEWKYFGKMKKCGGKEIENSN